MTCWTVLQVVSGSQEDTRQDRAAVCSTLAPQGMLLNAQLGHTLLIPAHTLAVLMNGSCLIASPKVQDSAQ